VDLEKVFDRVPVWWTLRKLGVEEWLVKGIIIVVYDNVRTVMKTEHGNSEEFNFKVKVGVHQ